MARQTKEFAILMDYIKNLPDVATVAYEDIERDTGISMEKNSGHRQKLARAIMKCGRRGLPVLGIGYDIDRPETAVEIVRRSGRKVYSQIRRSSETHRVITKRHYAKMTEGEQDYMKQTGIVFNILERKTIDIKKIEIETVKEIQIPNIEDRK